jgi:prepilin-type N-terminal cleavage/methylation domain-containing protein
VVNKKAFTLIELVVVLIIIGLVYALYSPNFHSKKKITKFENLKEFLLSNYDLPIKLECFGDKCEQCFVNNKELKQYQIFTKKPKVYTLDMFGYLQEKSFQDDKKCFEFQIFSNKSSSNMLVEKNLKFYLFYAFYQKSKVFSDFEKAQKEYDNKTFLPQDELEFFGQTR